MPDKGSLEKQGARSGQNKVEVKVNECAIHSVVVYQDRAEVRRVVPANLVAGENEVIINGLAECVDKNSIRCVWCVCGRCVSVCVCVVCVVCVCVCVCGVCVCVFRGYSCSRIIHAGKYYNHVLVM